jgi:hypothetical protein
VNRGLSKLAALPTQRVVVSEHPGRLPARSTGNAIVARLDAGAAYSARLGIDKRERGVVERAELMDCGSQSRFSNAKVAKVFAKAREGKNSLRYFAEYFASFALKDRVVMSPPLKVGLLPRIDSSLSQREMRNKRGLPVNQETSDYGITHF